jgi:micrococcal nuclease
LEDLVGGGRTHLWVCAMGMTAIFAACVPASSRPTVETPPTTLRPPPPRPVESPRAEPSPLAPVEAGSASRRQAQVVRVIDGDTIDVTPWGRVRLLGINAPELHGGRQTRCFGAHSARRVRELLPPGSGVFLELDAEERDKYGRLLAYVYLADGQTMLNEILVANGFAMAMTIGSNVRYTRSFLDQQERARATAAGLWGECLPAVRPE